MFSIYIIIAWIAQLLRSVHEMRDAVLPLARACWYGCVLALCFAKRVVCLPCFMWCLLAYLSLVGCLRGRRALARAERETACVFEEAFVCEEACGRDNEAGNDVACGPDAVLATVDEVQECDSVGSVESPRPAWWARPVVTFCRTRVPACL